MNQHLHAIPSFLAVAAAALLLQACASPVPLDDATTKGTAGTQTGTPAHEPAQTGTTSKGSADGSAQTPTRPPHTVYFEFDSAEIRATSLGDVEALARYYREHGTAAAIVLEGHADERGSREYNLALGQKRAQSVLRALALLGVPPGRTEAISFGEEKPAVTGHDEAAWEKNRRVELIAR
jgi:peptidoglycan-associated lipoprotein